MATPEPEDRFRAGWRGAPVTWLLDRLVAAYQWLPWPQTSPCRFAPSCSVYARAALARHGAGRGMWLTLRRLVRCHPFHAGGLDPVPAARPRRTPRRSRTKRKVA